MRQSTRKKNSTLANRHKTHYEHKNTLLCDRCIENQKLKIEKLSNFQPQDEKTYDLEVKLYKEYMEKIYDLCDKCKSKVKFEITRQDGILKQYLYKMGKFDYLFERKIFGQRLNNFCNKARNSKLKLNSKFFLYLLILILSILIISFNDYSNNHFFQNLFFIFPKLSNQSLEIVANVSSLINNSNITKFNHYLPFFIVLNYILLCASLMVENENFKENIYLLTLNTILIIYNYQSIYKSFKYEQNVITNFNFVPVCTGLMILILFFKLKNITNKPLNNLRPIFSHQESGIPNLKYNSNQTSRIIWPAKLKSVSNSLFDFKPARASWDSSGKFFKK